MPDNALSEDSEGETFNLELDATQLHSLEILLHHSVINLDGRYSFVAESLSREVQDVKSSEEYMDMFDSEMEQFAEEMNDDMVPNTSSKGVQ